MSIRHNIVTALQTRLAHIYSGFEIILPDETYVCSSSPKSVSIWRTTPYSLAQVPAIGIWDTDQELDETIGPDGCQRWKLSVTVVGFVAGAAASEATRIIQDDIIACIGSDPTLDGLALWCRIPAVKMIIDESGAEVVAGCEISVEVLYRAGLWRI